MVIVIGSGAGGSLIAMELAKANIPVTIIERGPYIKSKDSFEYYDMKYYDKRLKNTNSVDLLKTTCIGGSTIVAAGNGVRLLEDEFKELGIDISAEYDKIEELVGIHQMDDEHIGKGTQLFIDCANELGFEAIRMPKFIRDEDCKPCGKCSFGCPRDAKWSGKDFVDIAIENGAELISDAEVTKVIFSDKKITGVEYIKDNIKQNISSDLVILCAGAVGKRSALKHSRVMIHQPLGGARGQASDILIAAQEIEKTRKELYSIISEHSGQPIEKIYADGDRDFWMTSQEALEYGMIDEILRKRK